MLIYNQYPHPSNSVIPIQAISGFVIPCIRLDQWFVSDTKGMSWGSRATIHGQTDTIFNNRHPWQPSSLTAAKVHSKKLSWWLKNSINSLHSFITFHGWAFSRNPSIFLLFFRSHIDIEALAWLGNHICYWSLNKLLYITFFLTLYKVKYFS